MEACPLTQRMMAWNETALDYPHVCLHELFEDQALKRLDEIAVVMGTEELTYKELNERANRLGHYLLRMGVGPDIPVGVYMDRCLELPVVLLGIMKAGGAYLPLDIEAPAVRIGQIFEEARLSVCVTHSEWSEGLPEGRCLILNLDEIGEELRDLPSDSPQSGIEPDHAVSVYYTSGSTGRPKGVVNLHRGWVNKMVSLQRMLKLKPKETILQKTTLTFDDAAVEFFWTLLCGGRIALLEPGLHRDPEAIVEAMRRYETVSLMVVPSMLNRIIDVMLENRHIALPKLRWVLAGGESLTSRMVHRYYEALPGLLYNTWGATEVSVDSTIHLCTEVDYDEDGAVCVGKPFDNNRVYVLDEHLRPVDVHVTGDLYLAGVGVSRGYLNDPERTAQAFLPDPFVLGDRMYRTGDRGSYRDDGSVKFNGRKDHQVKIRGIRVELGEIEAALLKHEKVKEAALLLREDTPSVKRLVAYIVSNHQNEKGLKSELNAYLKVSLPQYMIPNDMMLLERLPLNQNDKLDRHALPAPGHSRPDLNNEYVAPGNPLEAHLTSTFADVLRYDEVGVSDDFFELGGDSISATVVMARLRSTIHSKIELKALFQEKTAANLARFFETKGWTLQARKQAVVGLANREQELPLSFGQERLWFIQKLDTDKPTYNEPVAYRISGGLETHLLHAALNEIVRRHEILRTSFTVVDDRPVQRIVPNLTLELLVVDMRSVPEDKKEEALQETMTAESRIPFDMEEAPLARTKLLRLGEAEYVLLVNMHHMITDAWSGVVFTEELGILYDSMLKKRPVPLEELPFQYVDAAVWQRDLLKGETLEEDMVFWRQELSGHQSVLQLPTDYTRPSVQSFEGDRLYFTVEASFVNRIKRLAHMNDASVYMVLLSAYQILLHRYSRMSDILVGSPIANRSQSGLERLIGFFVNTIVIRSQFSGEFTFQQFLQQTKERCLNVYSHQDVPFEQLVRELQPERNSSYSPLVQAVFAFQNKLEEALTLTGLEVDQVNVNTKTSRYDLTLFLTETREGQFAGIWEYNTCLFKRETMEQLLENWKTLLEGIVSDPTQRIAELPIVSSSQMADMKAGNNTSALFPADLLLHELVEEQVRRTPNAVAAVFREETLTYLELEKRANRLARYLIAKGAGRRQFIGICMERSLDLVVALYAVLKSGSAFVPLDPEAPEARFAQILQDCQAVACLTQQSLYDCVPQGVAPVVLVDADWDIIAYESAEKPDVCVLPTDPVSVYYTSGSTGKPKGVVNLHVGWVNRMCWMQDQFQLNPGETVLQKTTLPFDDSAVEFFWPLITGGCIALLEPGLHRDPRGIIDATICYQAVHLQFVPSMLNLVLDEITPEDRARLPRLRSTISSGEALSGTTVRRFFEKLPGTLNNTWGATEVSIDSTIHVCVKEDMEEEGAVCVGKPISNNRCYVLDEHQQPVPVGVAGYLYLAGIGLAEGYLNNPEMTGKAFLPDPFVPGERMYRTGDLGCYRPDYSIKFIGRVDNQVKIRGMRVELGEIESVLFRHPNVKEAVVLVLEDAPGIKLLVAYAVPLHFSQSLTGEGLRNLMKETLPDYMVPSHVMILDRMPLNANGKIDRRQLPKPDRLSHDTEMPFVAPEGPIEAAVVEIWKDLLKIEEVGVCDDFFRLGGHSLLAAQIIARLRHRFQIELPLRDIFMKPTIRQLALEVEERLVLMIESISEEDAISLLNPN